MIRHGLAAIAIALAMTGTAAAAPMEARIGLPQEPVSLDLSTSADPATGWVSYGNIFEPLIRLDRDEALGPLLAASWAFSPDGLTLIINLRPEVRFHDGTTLDAGDVKFSLDRLLGKVPGLASVKAVEATDPLTVTLSLSKPDYDVVSVLSTNSTVIVAPESADNNATAPIGTGPFTLVDWTPGARIALERNYDYWGKPEDVSAAQPEVPKVVFVFPTDAEAAMAQLEAGQLDGMAQIPDFFPYEHLRGNAKLQFIGDGIWKAELKGLPEPIEGDRVEVGLIKWPK